MSELIEAVARAISGAPFPSTASTRKARAALQAIEAAGFRVVPVEASPGLLMSMAMRYDHALGMPGFYDQPIFGAENIPHARRLESALTTMRQLHEEVVGTGFYKPEREADYVAQAAPRIAP